MGRYPSSDVLLRNPITGIVGCCARAASGHAAAAPPSSVMNSRRLMSNMSLSPPWHGRSVYRALSLPQKGQLVLGADLNCSESSGGAADLLHAATETMAHAMRRKTAALRYFSPLYVRLGSFSSDRHAPAAHGMS